jgi:hypothetical protein
LSKQFGNLSLAFAFWASTFNRLASLLKLMLSALKVKVQHEGGREDARRNVKLADAGQHTCKRKQAEVDKENVNIGELSFSLLLALAAIYILAAVVVD